MTATRLTGTYPSAAAIFDELAGVTPIYAGMSYDRLGGRAAMALPR